MRGSITHACASSPPCPASPEAQAGEGYAPAAPGAASSLWDGSCKARWQSPPPARFHGPPALAVRLCLATPSSPERLCSRPVMLQSVSGTASCPPDMRHTIVSASPLIDTLRSHVEPRSSSPRIAATIRRMELARAAAPSSCSRPDTQFALFDLPLPPEECDRECSVGRECHDAQTETVGKDNWKL
jgi:hypothetical protein